MIQSAIQDDNVPLIKQMISKFSSSFEEGDGGGDAGFEGGEFENTLIQLILAGAKYTSLVPRDILIPFLSRLANEMDVLRRAYDDCETIDLSGLLYCAYVNRDNPCLKSIYMNEYIQFNKTR